MSARKFIGLIAMLFILGVLVMLPQSTQAGRRGPGNLGNTVLANPGPQDEVPAYNGERPIINEKEENEEDHFRERSQYASTRRAAGDTPLTDAEVAEANLAAATQTQQLRESGVNGSPEAYGGGWTGLGPNPIVQVSRVNTITYMAGRIGALAFRSDGRMILGGATGGIWVFNDGTGKWEPKTDNLPALPIGALAVAPSNEDVVYAGTGEGETSGDSAAGNGVLKSLDGGMTWFHVSGAYFRGVSTANIAVDPTNADHLWIATMRGRGGARRTTTPPNDKYGVWESTNGGLDWTLLKGTNDPLKGATDVRVDPQDPTIVYASFWGVGIFKSTDSGQNWTKINNGFPADADFSAVPTRFAIAISHPIGQDAVLYTGFDYDDTNGVHQPSRVWKSTDEGASWTILPGGTSPENVEDYCATQCTYDNVIEVAPDDPDVVFAGGQFDYGLGYGGIYRSDDGGQNWKNLGYEQHPDFHQLAFNPADTQQVLVGSDGGVWYSGDRGGRTSPTSPIDDVTWESLNGFLPSRTDLQIAQFTSIANVPTVPGRYWGGTQDNGTVRKSTASQSWSDMYSGDGGQVLVDPTDANYVYGTYFGISPYRDDTGGVITFFSNSFIRSGLNLNDRSDFYVPFTMNQDNPNQLFLGTYRLYRTDNAKAADSSDVLWKPISGDLTSGCTGSAPNGARGCMLSAIGVSRGGGGVWVGSLDGYVNYAPQGTMGDSPHFKRVGAGVLPNRPVAGIAVDNSNSRIAYLAYNGYNGATPGFPGHVFKTKNGGRTWTNLTGNLPNVPANWIILDPSEADTLYVGTDTGPFVTYDGGDNWSPLGTGFPITPVWQMDLDPLHRVLLAGTHGRGAFKLDDSATLKPALVLSKTYPDTPVGPDTDVSFTLTIKNIGNAAATGIDLQDRLPKNTSFVSASDGGYLKKGFVRWDGLTVASNTSQSVTMTLHISASAKKIIKNKNFSLTSAEGNKARGTPRNLKMSDPQATMISPDTQSGAANPGDSVDYTLTVRNLGFTTDTFQLKVSGNDYPTEVRDASCTTVITETSALSGGDSEDICVRVTPPESSSAKREGLLPESDTATVKATSSGDPSVKATAEVVTYRITADILLVDNDDGNPDVQAYYTTALDTYGQPYDVWDLADGVLPQNMLTTHLRVVWFTGGSYPGPILPYEEELAEFLDGGGRLFMSGQDILDQAAGTTDFVYDYLHIDWDGTDVQNDKVTADVTGVGGNPVSGSIGTIPLDHSVLNLPYEDQITLVSPALAAFTDDTAEIDALTVDTDGYMVMFLAFPFEEYGNASQKATLLSNALNWFDVVKNQANTSKVKNADKGNKGNKDVQQNKNGGKKNKKGERNKE